MEKNIREMQKLNREIQTFALTNLQEELVQSIDHSLRALAYEFAEEI